MRKYIILFSLLSLSVTFYFLFKNYSGFFSNSSYVSIEGGKFNLKEKPFFPLVVNYVGSLQSDENNIWGSPSPDYNENKTFRFTNKDSCLMDFKSDMELIKEMGFNCIRLVGIGEVWFDETKSGELSIPTTSALTNKAAPFVLTNSEKNYNLYFSALEEILDIIKDADLKVILLVRMSTDYTSTEDHLALLSYHFKDNNTIMAYDLFNEPLYFDKIGRPKDSVAIIVHKWNNIVKRNENKQLTTIGLEGIREIFEWDPNILDVDFISYHPYEYELEQVRNEIFWYGKYTNKPWIIGETAISANNDSISYKEQKLFAEKTINQTYNCGGIGYSWWQYKDVEWFKYHSNFMGVVSQKGITLTKKGGISIKGTPKPVADVIKNFNPSKTKKHCICLENYYNYSNSTVFKLTGRLVDIYNNPIEGGVIMAWNKDWSHSYHTISKANGGFELLGSYPFYHWIASATRYSVFMGEVLPDTLSSSINGEIPSINIGKIPLTKLSFPVIDTLLNVNIVR